MSFLYVHRISLEDGIDQIRKQTPHPIGMNIILESQSAVYRKRVRQWLDIGLKRGVRFFTTAIGNPDWVTKIVHDQGGLVYHDATELKWAKKALDAGVDGIIAVNNRAGGHLGPKTAEQLRDEFQEIEVPVICAGGISTPDDFVACLQSGYQGVQMGTRFIATQECSAPQGYKEAIVASNENDIVVTERVTGVPLSVIQTDHVKKIGTKAGPIARWMLRGRKLKKLMRLIYVIRSFGMFQRAEVKGYSSKDYLQAGKSVEGVDSILPAGRIVQNFAEAVRCHQGDAANNR